jgi:hypothetical protein
LPCQKLPKTLVSLCYIQCLLMGSSRRSSTDVSKGTQRKHTNAPFREALGLSTSDADLQTFTEIKKNIRDIVQAYYDFDLPDSEQTDVTRAAFAAEV